MLRFQLVHIDVRKRWPVGEDDPRCNDFVEDMKSLMDDPAYTEFCQRMRSSDQYHGGGASFFDDESDDDDNSSVSSVSVSGRDAVNVGLFGVDAKGRSVFIEVPGFRPHVTLEIPDHWSTYQLRLLTNALAKHGKVMESQVSCRVVKRFRAVGWVPQPGDATQRRLFRYAMVYLPTIESYYKVRYAIRKNFVKINGEKQEFIIADDAMLLESMFCEDTGLCPSGWVEISHTDLYQRPNRITWCAVEMAVDKLEALKPVPESEWILAPLMVASLDIEAWSEKHQFPQEPEDLVTCINVVARRVGQGADGKTRRGVALLTPRGGDAKRIRDTWPALLRDSLGLVRSKTTKGDVGENGLKLEHVPDELVDEIELLYVGDDQVELMNCYRDFIVIDCDVDLITGYNIFGFDFKFMDTRVTHYNSIQWRLEMDKYEAKMKQLKEEYAHRAGGPPRHLFPQRPVKQVARYHRMSKYIHESTYGKVSTFKSAAKGEIEKFTYDLTGRVLFDMMLYVQDQDKMQKEKLKSYKLDLVAEKYLKRRKIDMPPAEIFRAYECGDMNEFGRLILYCDRDAELPLELVETPRFEVVANQVAMSRVSRVPMQMLFTRGQQVKVYTLWVLEAHKYGAVVNRFKFPMVDYQGAIVIEPKSGFYREPISTLDFKSLYPTTMIAFNLCPSTLVANKRYMSLPGAEYEGTDICDADQNVLRTHTFVKHHRGIVPRVLQTLLEQRSLARKELRHEKDPRRRAMLNGRQLALKLTANSMYGFYGAQDKGILPVVMVSETTTARGRMCLGETQRYILDNYPGSDIVYGDSVVGSTPLILRHPNSNMMEVRSIESLMDDEDSETDSKIYGDTYFQVWSDTGFVDIVRVIKHRLRPDCNVWRIGVGKSWVDVTSDHSLLRADRSIVKPTQLTIGDRLLVSDLPKGLDLDLTGKFTNEEFEQVMWVRGLTNDATDHVTYIEDVTNWYRGEYVYDLETESGHFSAGVGRIVVHNTDSVMVKFANCGDDSDGIQKSFHLGEEAADQVTKLFPDPVELEMEKVYCPYILYKKKQYAALKYEDPTKPAVRDIAGLKPVRRDTIPFIGDLFKKMINAMLEERGADGAIRELKLVMDKLVKNEFPVEAFIKTVGVKSDYKNPNQVQLVIRDKMNSRNPGSAPRPGTRMGYVLVETDNLAEDKTYRMAEDPQWAKEHCKINREYYLKRNLKKPVTQLLEPVVDNPASLFAEAERKLYNERRGQRELCEFLSVKRDRPDSGDDSDDDIIGPPMSSYGRRKHGTITNTLRHARTKQPSRRRHRTLL